MGDAGDRGDERLYWVFTNATDTIHSGPFWKIQDAYAALPKGKGVVYAVPAMYMGLTTRKAAKSNG